MAVSHQQLERVVCGNERGLTYDYTAHGPRNIELRGHRGFFVVKHCFNALPSVADHLARTDVDREHQE